MDDTAPELSPLEQRRAELRALSDDIMETIKPLPKPQSWLEGDRAMRCLGTTNRVMVQLFSKVKAHTPSEHRQALVIRPAAPVRATIPVQASGPEAPLVYNFDDNEIGASDTPPEDSDSSAALDAALDDMESLLDAIDCGETPILNKRSAQSTAAANRDTPYHNLAQHLARGRDLLMELPLRPDILPYPPLRLADKSLS